MRTFSVVPNAFPNLIINLLVRLYSKEGQIQTTVGIGSACLKLATSTDKQIVSVFQKLKSNIRLYVNPTM